MDVDDWVSRAPERKTAGIYRLTGVAGSGKSAVAHQLARRYHDKKILAASFFFDRETVDRNSPKKVWSTIAREMAGHNSDLLAPLALRLEEDPSIASASPSRQFQSLILGTCKDLSSNTPTVIVIDALDEGMNDEILEILRDDVPKLREGYCVLLTSRPDENIDHYLSNCEHVFQRFIDLSSEDNKADVASYIWSCLCAIAKRRKLDETWLKQEIYPKFIERAEGLFIWVSTVAAYIIRATDPKGELRKILADGHQQTLRAEEQMDRLYELILSNCHWDDAFESAYPLIMGAILAVQRPLSVSALQILHRDAIEPDVVKRIVGSLGAVLTSSENDERPLRIIHQSFRDFLTTRALHNPLRSRFFINEKEQSARLAVFCFRTMNEELSAGISGTGYLEEWVDDAGIPRVGEISEQLWYACEFWKSHLDSVENSEIGPLINEMKDFLPNRLILWIEIVSSKGTLQSVNTILLRAKVTSR